MAIDESTLDAIHGSLASRFAILIRVATACLQARLRGCGMCENNVGFACNFGLMLLLDSANDLQSLVQGLPVGSLILEDLGYFGFAWLDWLSDAGYWFISRVTRKDLVSDFAHLRAK